MTKRASKVEIPEFKSNVYRVGRTIYFFDSIDEDSVCDTIRILDAMESESNKKEIYIILSSGGGNAYDGLALYDRIRQSECQIIIVGTGMVASMGLIIFLAGDERRITENTRLLNHQVSADDFGGRTSDFKIESKEFEELQSILTDIVAERTGETVKQITRDIALGDKWISAAYALEHGYADFLIKNTRTYRKKKGKQENEK